MPYTLNISFTESVPPSTFGYEVTYWSVNNPSNTTTIVTSNSPVVITNLYDLEYEGTIAAICGPGQTGVAIPFSASTTQPTYTMLMFTGYVDGQFVFTLDTEITNPIVITSASVTGFSTEKCSSEPGLPVDMLLPPTTLTIPSGSKFGSAPGVGLDCGSTLAYRKGLQIEVQGQPLPLSNGDTFTIGSTTVLVQITNDCIPYLCSPRDCIRPLNLVLGSFVTNYIDVGNGSTQYTADTSSLSAACALRQDLINNPEIYQVSFASWCELDTVSNKIYSGSIQYGATPNCDTFTDGYYIFMGDAIVQYPYIYHIVGGYLAQIITC